MSTDQIKSMAEEIANLIIDKTFWGNEWFLIFTLVLVGIVSAACAWCGSYISTRAQNKAMRVDFDNALSDIKKQTDAVKRIEEEISHDYQERREILKIKRDKVEEIYLSLSSEAELLAGNLRISSLDEMQDVSYPNNKVEMLLALYFKEELERELELYLKNRKALISRVRELCQENLSRTRRGTPQRFEDNLEYFRNYNQAKVNIELGLECIMKNLTSRSS